MTALLCDRVEWDPFGNPLNILGIRRTFTRWDFRPDAPREMPAVRIPFVLFLAFVAGATRGAHNAAAFIVPPKGKRAEAAKFEVKFRSEDHDLSFMTLDMTIEADTPGVWWIEVEIDRRLVSRIPLEVEYDLGRSGK
jgi:hypothetical protein